MAIIPIDIQNPTVKIFNPNGTLLCETNNELVFNDIRIQIKDQKLSGYYIEINDEKSKIENDGMLTDWPRDLFTILTTQLNYLLGL